MDLQPLNISALRIIKTATNYGKITKAITAFDACVSGGAEIPNTDPKKKYGKILSRLIEIETGATNVKEGFDDYVIKSFHTFVLNKNDLILMIGFVVQDVEDKQLLDKILISPKISKWEDGETEFIRREETDRTNLFQPGLIDIFSNVEDIDLYMNDFADHTNNYTISLIALLSIIDGTQISRVMIVYYWTNEEGLSWIESLWQLHGESIRTKYKAKGYSIAYEDDDRHNNVIIEKR